MNRAYEAPEADQAYRHGLVDGRNGRPNPTAYSQWAAAYIDGYNESANLEGWQVINVGGDGVRS